MTYDEIVDLALARVRDAGRSIPRVLLLRRVGQAQASLFAAAATWNPEYYGVCVTATLNGGGADLNGLTPPLNQAAGIQRIEVATSSGTGAPAPGTRISIVPLADPDSGLAPRATVRDNVLRGWGAELAQVTAVRLYYARLSNPVGPGDGAVTAELREPWRELLVLDLAGYVFALLQAEGRDVNAALQKMLADEAAGLAAQYEAHVRAYLPDAEDRFRRTGGGA